MVYTVNRREKITDKGAEERLLGADSILFDMRDYTGVFNL